MTAKTTGANGDHRERKCLNGLSAATRVQPPSDDQFGVNRYVRADAIQQTIEAMIRDAAHGLGAILEAEVSIGARWVRTGSKQNGKPTLAKIAKCGPSLKFESGRDFLLDVAADQVRELGLTHWQLEALVFHNLKHVGVTVDSDSDVALSIAPHDAELFADEIALYGAWMADHGAVRETFRQAPLFGDVVESWDRQRKALETAD